MAFRWILAVTAMASVSLSGALADGISASQDARNKINLAGRQRMLTQAVVKEGCFAVVLRESNRLGMVDRSVADFEKGARGLIEGDATLQLLPETRADVRSAHGDTASAFRELKSLLDAAALTTPSKSDLAKWDAAAGKTLAQAEQAVTVLVGSVTSIDTTRARTINVAGRQRMLAQASAKEFCLIAAGQDASTHRKRLAETTAVFSASQADLLAGRGGIDAPSERMVSELKRVERLWTALTPLYARATGGEPISTEGAKQVAERTERLVQEMDRAVFHYSVSE